jgi:hypothetical protein
MVNEKPLQKERSFSIELKIKSQHQEHNPKQ